jgi:hypothetical protein
MTDPTTLAAQLDEHADGFCDCALRTECSDKRKALITSALTAADAAGYARGQAEGVAGLVLCPDCQTLNPLDACFATLGAPGGFQCKQCTVKAAYQRGKVEGLREAAEAEEAIYGTAADCEQCGELSLCPVHSVISRLRQRAEATGR